MSDTLSLNTRVRNSSGVPAFFGFLGPRGTEMTVSEVMDFPGNLINQVSGKPRDLAGLSAALLAGQLEIISSPASLIVDATTGAVKQVRLNNGTLSVTDPNWGAFVSLVTAAFGALTTPTSSAVASETLVFSNALAASGLPVSALTLTKNAGSNLLTGTQAPTTSDNITWTIPSLTSLTGTAGTYVLTLLANTVTDIYGNQIATPVTVTWVHS